MRIDSARIGQGTINVNIWDCLFDSWIHFTFVRQSKTIYESGVSFGEVGFFGALVEMRVTGADVDSVQLTCSRQRSAERHLIDEQSDAAKDVVLRRLKQGSTRSPRHCTEIEWPK